MIPNREIVGEILHNYGRIRQVDMTVGVAFDTARPGAEADRGSAERERTQCFTTCAGHRVRLFADCRSSIAAKPWVRVQDYGPSAGEINKGILEAFREHGIVIPYPRSARCGLLQDPA